MKIRIAPIQEIQKEYYLFEQMHLDLIRKLDRDPAIIGCPELFNSFRKETISSLKKMGTLAEFLSSSERKKLIKSIRSSEFYRICQQAPFFCQIIRKPYGYSGDAILMDYAYGNTFEGESTYGRFLHKIATSYDANEAVRNRKSFLVSEIRKVNTGNILSVAAGPAGEIQEYLRTHKKIQGNPSFYAVDHDIEAYRFMRKSLGFYANQIQYAIGNVFDIWEGNYQVAYPRAQMLNFISPNDFNRKSLSNIIKYKIGDLSKRSYNLIYSAGLYDYIPLGSQYRKGANFLTKKLFDLLAPGGKIIIGNFSKNICVGTKFIMEYIMDWKLIYRDDEEIMRFAMMIPKNSIASLNLTKEPLGINSFLEITKN